MSVYMFNRTQFVLKRPYAHALTNNGGNHGQREKF